MPGNFRQIALSPRAFYPRQAKCYIRSNEGNYGFGGLTNVRQMKLPGREERLIRSIHRHLLITIVAAAIVGVLLFFGLYRAGLLGPIVGGRFDGYTLEWKVSDHHADGTPLDNSLIATDQPQYSEYSGEVIVELQRQNDGNLQKLPRFQGTLEYRKSSDDD